MKPNTPIVLPRPNLGPEPWPDAPVWPWLVATAVLILLTIAAVGLRRRRAKKKSLLSQTVESAPVIPASPILADPVREALVRAFGPSWRARTTEEAATSSALSGRFGDEATGQIVAYLHALDRAKFSGDASAPPDDLGWWAARFVEEVDARPKNISKSKES